MAGDTRTAEPDRDELSGAEGFSVESDADFSPSDDRTFIERLDDTLRGGRNRDGGGKPASKKRSKPETVRETPPQRRPALERDISLDVRDGYKAAAKSAQRVFGSIHPQLGNAWELDNTEITLLASPTTRLIKQTSDVASKTSSPWFTGAFLVAMGALIVGPRLYFTRQIVRALQLQADQGGAVQAAQEQLRQQKAATARNGAQPSPRPGAPAGAGYDPLRDILVDRE